jgi:hypothetical protein
MTEGTPKQLIGNPIPPQICPIDGCRDVLEPGAPFCGRHWAMVPADTKGRIALAQKLYRPYRNLLGVRKAGGEAIAEYTAAAKAAIETEEKAEREQSFRPGENETDV